MTIVAVIGIITKRIKSGVFTQSPVVTVLPARRDVTRTQIVQEWNVEGATVVGGNTESALRRRNERSLVVSFQELRHV